MHPTGGTSDGSEEGCCLDFSKTLMLPGFAYLFLFFNCRKPVKASVAKYFEKLIQYVSLLPQKIQPLASRFTCACLICRQIQDLAAKRTELHSFCNYFTSKRDVDATSNHLSIHILALEEEKGLSHWIFSLISLVFITVDPKMEGLD